MDYLGDLAQHGVLQVVLLEKGLEGAVVPAVREPGPGNVEELRLLGRLGRVPEEAERGPAVQEAPDQPHARRPVDVATPRVAQRTTARPPRRASPPSCGASLTARRAALRASWASSLAASGSSPGSARP